MEEPLPQYKPIEKLELKDIQDPDVKPDSKVYCPSCNEIVIADNLNLQNKLAKCGSCNSVFSIADHLDSLHHREEKKQEVLRPEGIDLFYFRDSLDITIQQHIQGLDAAGIIFFPILAVFSILLYAAGKIDGLMYLPIALTIGAIYYIYRAFNYDKNKTFIDVNKKSLSIKSRPKHFRKDKIYSANEIDQLYIKFAMDGSGYYTIFLIVNGLEGQKHEKLVTVNTLSKAKYLEQEIEKYLGIKNRKVPEENA